MLKGTSLLPALAFLTICLIAPAVYADSVTLTGGSASTFVGIGTVNLFGNDFVLHYSGEIPPGATMAIGMNSVTQSIGLPNVTFAGVTSRFFGGSLAFDESLLTGGVTAYGTMEDMFFGTNPLFTVDFRGMGFVTRTLVDGFVRTKFMVSQAQPSAVPEPASMFLLGAGLGAIAAHRRRSRKTKS